MEPGPRKGKGVTARGIAVRRVTDAVMAWLDAFAVDAATYDALANRGDGPPGRSVLAFHGDIPLLLQDTPDRRIAVIGRYNQGAQHFAIPRGTDLPQSDE